MSYIVNTVGDAFRLINVDIYDYVLEVRPLNEHGSGYYIERMSGAAPVGPVEHLYSSSTLTATGGGQGNIKASYGDVSYSTFHGITFYNNGSAWDLSCGDSRGGRQWCMMWGKSSYFAFVKLTRAVAGCTHALVWSGSDQAIQDGFLFSDQVWSHIIEYGAEDPYKPTGGDSEGGIGGDGIHTDTSEDIDVPADPTLTACAAGFVTLFTPTISQIQNLASYMWSGAFDIASWRKIFADPMDAILGMSIMPVTVPVSGVDTVKVGNISTGISMNKASSQYVTVNCGTLNVDELWGAYLDYDPYTKAEIYLPYIGNRAVRVDDIMDKAVTITYKVDVTCGACVCFIKCAGSVLYQFQGQCGIQIPISRNDWSNVFRAGVSIAGSIGATVATGGLAAPAAVALAASTATNVMAMKPNVQKSGSMSGSGGLLGIQKPYLIITRPRQCKPANQNTYTGYPAYVTKKLDDLRGYTTIDQIHLEGIPGTRAEIDEIDKLLKSGVIL